MAIEPLVIKPTITFRHMDHSIVIEEQALKELRKLERLLQHERTPVTVELVLEAQPVHAHHRVELRVHTPHYQLIAHRVGSHIPVLINEVIEVMADEIRKAKDKRVDAQQKTHQKA